MYIMKTAKEFFKSHPKVQLVYHWNTDALSPANREIMFGPRTVKVIGHRAVFGPHQSEMSLKTENWIDTVIDDKLCISMSNKTSLMIYKAIGE